ncbi:MAG: hypothetical protein VB858_01320 [Planctomycetaceae bacterium]
MRFLPVLVAISVQAALWNVLPSATHPLLAAEPDPPGTAADPGPDWGTLQLQFRYDGKPPVPQKIRPVRGAELCGKYKIVDEELLVDPKTGGLRNVIVMLNHKRGELPRKLPDIVQGLANRKVRMTNKGCRFEPHVAVLWTEQTLELANDDPGVHNMLANLIYNSPFNQVIPGDTAVSVALKRAEKLPRDISCSIHPYMRGWLVVKDHPYSAVSGNTGQAVIAHLPVGDWEFQLWHEKAGYLSEIMLNGRQVTGRKGVYTWKIKPGKNGILPITVSSKIFQSDL